MEQPVNILVEATKKIITHFETELLEIKKENSNTKITLLEALIAKGQEATSIYFPGDLSYTTYGIAYIDFIDEFKKSYNKAECALNTLSERVIENLKDYLEELYEELLNTEKPDENYETIINAMLEVKLLDLKQVKEEPNVNSLEEHSWNYTGTYWKELYFTGLNQIDKHAEGITFFDVDFEECDFYNAAFKKCVFEDVCFSFSFMNGLTFEDCIFIDCVFMQCEIEDDYITFKNCITKGIEFKDCKFPSISFQ